MAVASDLKGRGLGWRMMELLIEYARHERLAELHGQVLAENQTMLQMCRELGFKINSDATDRSVNQVRLELSALGGRRASG